MKQQQREWKIFGHVLTPEELGIAILMLVALLSGVAGIWLGPITNVLVLASVVAIAVLVWRTTIQHKVIRIILLVLEAFVGLSALSGGIAILQGVVFGFVLPRAWLAGTPWSSYTIPGLALVMVVGGTALIAAATVFIEREWTVLVSVLAGLFMAGYEMVEVVSLDSKFGDALPTFLGLQLVYFVLGLAIFGLAGYLWMKDYRILHFHYRHASHA